MVNADPAISVKLVKLRWEYGLADLVVRIMGDSVLLNYSGS